MTSRPGTRLFQVGQKRGLEDATTREDNRKKRLTDSMKHDPDSSRGDEILEEATAQAKDATNTADVQAQK